MQHTSDENRCRIQQLCAYANPQPLAETFEVLPALSTCAYACRYLCEQVFKQPTVVYNYPAEIKAFYMKLNGDGKTVAAMDVLVPGVGELVGGSQREDNLELLEQRIKAAGMELEPYEGYLDMRRYGGVPHSGLGFARLVMSATGVANLRDVIPFPRYPGSATF